jgi:POT family proton-dependent oligopeptide transporter
MNNKITNKSDHCFFGHPRGLAYIAFTEAWERFSFYGMQTLLVLYMVQYLLLPDHLEHIVGFASFRSFIENIYGVALSNLALASAIFGLYTGFVYLTPIIGGFIADRFLGKTLTIIIGALLMAIGHFLMAFDSSFLIALICLIVGVGCFKGNLANQINDLYQPNDIRHADAYQIYLLFINGSVILTPLIVGTIGEIYGWHYGFGIAGIGMLVALIIYLSGLKWLPKEKKLPYSKITNTPVARLKKHEFRSIFMLLLLLPLLAISIIGNQQIFNAYLLWVPKNVDLIFFGHQMPTTWLITIDSVTSVSCLILSLAFWRLWSKHFREPSEITKIIIGSALAAAGLMALVIAAMISASGQKASIGWVLIFGILNDLGFANIFPVGLALYSKTAPKAIAGTLMGIYYLHIFIGNNLVGWLGGLIEHMSGVQFWLLHFGLVTASTILMYMLARLFKQNIFENKI